MRVRLTRRSRRFAIGGASLLLVPIGVAHLAQNSVATSYVSESEATVTINSGLTVTDAHVNVAQEDGEQYYHFTDMMATLTDGDRGVDGERIVFTSAGYALCTAQTNGGGHATCDAKVAVDQFPDGVPLTFTATFAGDPPLEASHQDGALTITGGGSELTGNSDNNSSNGSNGKG